MSSKTKTYMPPVLSSYGRDGSPDDLADIFVKRQLVRKKVHNTTLGTDKLYGYESGGGWFGAFAYVAANVAAVVNAVAYSNAAVATLAVAVLAVFPGNMQGVAQE
jgi:hypothetical protein